MILLKIIKKIIMIFKQNILLLLLLFLPKTTAWLFSVARKDGSFYLKDFIRQEILFQLCAAVIVRVCYYSYKPHKESE